MQKVLALFANPTGTDRLRLGAEDRTIRECIRRGRDRDKVGLVVRHAATVKDVRQALLEDDFTMVHFSGHGTRNGLMFEDEGGAHFVPPQSALAELLADYAPTLQCVLLNACYSVSQGEFTSLGLEYTIAMERPISDAAAIAFSEAFYDSIGAGKDIPFSYRQGIHQLRLARSPEHSTPILLCHGETHQPVTGDQSTADARGAVAPTSGNTLIGVALDVSGSMADSFDNQDSDVRSRLETVRASLARFADAELDRQLEEAPSPGRIFAYAFGLRSGAVCDLLSMLKVADQVMSRDEAEALGQRYADELRARYSGGGVAGLGDLLRSYGQGGLVDLAEGVGRHEVKRRVAAEAQRRMELRLAELGDTTMEIGEFARFWKDSAAGLSDAELLIYGDTPMRTALVEIRDRFARELHPQSHGRTTPVLLLVSDGEPTDGDPSGIAAEIRKLGVTIVVCYLTEVDLTSPRLLRAEPSADWPEGASRLFRLASRLDIDSPLCRYLLREGWSVEPGAACFIQVNHSETLDGFVSVLANVRTDAAELLPRGR
jgi:hypothetical protein